MARTKVHGEYLDPSVISAQTEVTAVGSDHMLIFDATDNALKKALLSDLIETVGSTPTFTGLTVNSSEVLFDNTSGDFTLKLNTNAVSDKNEIIMGDTGTPLAKFGVGGTANDIITGSDGQDFNIGTAGGGRAINFSTDNFASVEMKLDGGNLGVGTSSPTSWASYTDSAATVLQVQDTSQRARVVINGGNGAHLDLVDYAGSSDDKHMNIAVDSGVLKFGSLNDAGNAFVQNNIMVMDLGTGQVGIGTSSPSAKLNVSSGSVKIVNSGTDAYFLEGVRDGGNVTLRMYDNSNNLYIDSYTNMSFRANQTGGGSGGNIFFGGGNVGIGLPSGSPDARLTVSGSANSEQVIITGNGNQSRGLSILTAATGGQQDAKVIFNAQDTENVAYPAMQFETGGQERIRMHHVSTIFSTRIGLNYPSELMFNGEYTAGQQDVAVEAGHAARIEFLKDDFLRFQGSASVAAGAGVSYADKLKINIDSGGILFGSDTAAANTLDDYEEGSFTPSLQNTGNSSAPTGAGYYCKIGGVVYVSMYFSAITITSAGNTRIAGMPFTASVPGSAYSICYYTHGTILSDNRGGGGYFTGTFIDLIAFGSTGYNTWSVGNTKYGMWSGFYFTNS